MRFSNPRTRNGGHGRCQTEHPLLAVREATCQTRTAPTRRAQLIPLAQILWNGDYAEEFLHFAPWLFIPHRLGSRISLDASLCAFALQVRGHNHADESLLARAQTSYVTALSALQHAIDHPPEWKSSETLCSAMLLCPYESFAGTSSSSGWLKHAHGGRIMETRGSQPHKSTWDVSMVDAFRGLLIMQSLFTQQDGFLARGEWREVLRVRNKGPAGETVEQFWLYLSLCPAIVWQAHDLRARRLCGEFIDPGEIIDVSQQAETLHSRLSHWYHGMLGFLPPPEERPSQSPEALSSTLYTFRRPG
ncbi:hypothetical protein ACO1O0_008878 [Amphichorda felina]